MTCSILALLQSAEPSVRAVLKTQVFGGPRRKGTVILEIYPVREEQRLVVTRDTPT